MLRIEFRLVEFAKTSSLYKCYIHHKAQQALLFDALIWYYGIDGKQRRGREVPFFFPGILHNLWGSLEKQLRDVHFLKLFVP